jgi:hypothetical protein
MTALEATNGPSLFGHRILDILRFIEDNAAPMYLYQIINVAPCQAVAADDQIVFSALIEKVSTFGAPTPVVYQDLQVGREAPHLTVPVAH